MDLALGHIIWWECQGLLTFGDQEQNGTAGKGQLQAPRLCSCVQLLCASEVTDFLLH